MFASGLTTLRKRGEVSAARILELIKRTEAHGHYVEFSADIAMYFPATPSSFNYLHLEKVLCRDNKQLMPWTAAVDA